MAQDLGGLRKPCQCLQEASVQRQLCSMPLCSPCANDKDVEGWQKSIISIVFYGVRSGEPPPHASFCGTRVFYFNRICLITLHCNGFAQNQHDASMLQLTASSYPRHVLLYAIDCFRQKGVRSAQFASLLTLIRKLSDHVPSAVAVRRPYPGQPP